MVMLLLQFDRQAHNPPLGLQEARELAQALRVQAMSDEARSLWLTTEWGRVQRQAGYFRAQVKPHQPGARTFATWEEKNEFDAARELEFALERSIFAMAFRAGQNEATRA